ncbi:MAG TPA: transketolase C-terminal domain-containing protein [Blastocatellia bacterium]
MTYEETLAEVAAENANVIVMTAENRAAIRNLPQALGGRFIDFGISEQTMIGAAAGMALRGRVPVAHALAAFLVMRAFEFIRTDIGIAGLPVKLVGGVPGFLSEANGPTHQAIEDISLMRQIPNMRIFCPADEPELTSGLPGVIESPFPCYVRYNASPRVAGARTEFEFGKAEVLAAGSDAAILTYGFLVNEAMKASIILDASGISTRVINLRTLAPIDKETILTAAAECRLIVTLEDHFQTGGLYSIVAEILLEARKTAEVLPISFNQRWFKPAMLADAVRYEGFAGDQIAERILARLTGALNRRGEHPRNIQESLLND